MEYLTNLSDLGTDSLYEKGIHKVLLVRKESIHHKHVMTEMFVRKTIDLKSFELLKFDVFSYLEFMTNRLRKIYKIDRSYKNDSCDNIVKTKEKSLFNYLDTFRNTENAKLILDFDGVCTKNYVKQLYPILHNKLDIIICSANPTVSFEWFDKNNLKRPLKIYANKGKQKKILKLKELAKKYPILIYVDDEEEYLKYAWILGIHTFIRKETIKKYSLKTLKVKEVKVLKKMYDNTKTIKEKKKAINKIKEIKNNINYKTLDDKLKEFFINILK